MKKKFLLCSLIVGGLYLNAQKVGINTDNPTQTLDVEGSMRVGKLGDRTSSALPLSWNPQNQQVVLGNTDSYNSDDPNLAFHIRNYTLNVRQRGQDYIRDIDLGIDATKYVAVLTQASLVKKGFRAANLTDTGEVFLKALMVDRSGHVLSYISAHHAKTRAKPVVGQDGVPSNQFGGDLQDGTYPAQPVKRTNLFVSNGKYHFYGDYQDSNPINEGIYYSWSISVLVMNKNLVHELQ